MEKPQRAKLPTEAVGLPGGHAKITIAIDLGH